MALKLSVSISEIYFKSTKIMNDYRAYPDIKQSYLIVMGSAKVVNPGGAELKPQH
ncbi:hypothetical protein FG05_35380 [Fusarium graminearum]|nr:hypothetical protein FG05_35380 [Fusarium graminearum]